MPFFGSLRSRARKRVLLSLGGDPAWAVLVNGRAWICPYCAQVGVEEWPEGEEARADAALDHLVDLCLEFHEGEGTARPLIELKREATLRELRRRVKKDLARNAAWQLMDLRRRWFCPFCGEPTEVEIPGDKVMTEDVLRAIVLHVDGCHAYDKGKAEIRPLPELKATVKNANRARKLSEDVRRKVEQDPVWRQKDPRARWICPFCLAAQQHIDLSTSLLMFENAPALIARHLLVACERWREGATPRLAPPGGRTPSSMAVRVAQPGPASFPERSDHASEEVPTADERSSQRIASSSTTSRPTTRKKTLTEVWGRDALNAPADPSSSGGAHKKGTTLRELESSGVSHMIDDPEVRKVTSSNRPTTRKVASTVSPNASSGASSAPSATGGVPLTPAAPASSGASTGSKSSVSGLAADDNSGSQSRSLEWRREIERELAAVRSQVPSWNDGSSHGLEDTAQADVREAAQVAEGLPGVELRLLLRPASSPRGDFVEVLKLDEGRLGILLGGVAGDEAEGALVAAMARNLIRLNARRESDPAVVLRRVNQEIFQDLDARTFVSASYAILDARSSTLTVARAGLPAPFLVNRARTPVFGSVECEGMVMGIDRGPIFDTTVQSRSTRLIPGDLVVFVSSGILEVRSAGREEFGFERIENAVRRYGLHEAEYLVHKVAQVLEDWTRGSDPGADSCLAAVKLADAAAKS